MRTSRAVTLGLAALLLGAPARAADETPAKGKIVAVDLFKNGLAVIRCEVTLGKPGVYALDDVPGPVHGTYWVESPGPVETVVRMREVEVPAAEAAPGDLQEDLAGKAVTVHFKGDRRPPVTGTVMRFKPARGGDDPAGLVVPPTRFLVLHDGEEADVRRGVGDRRGRGGGRRRDGPTNPPPAAAHPRADGPGRDHGHPPLPGPGAGLGARATGSTSPTRRRWPWSSTRSSGTSWPTWPGPRSG